MKTPKIKARGLYLKKTNNRWKWMAGATAATASGITASQASTITIDLVDNYINGFGENHLNADLTGDGHPDLTIANVSQFYEGARATLNGVQALCHLTVDYGNPFGGFMQLGSRSADFHYYRRYSGTIYSSGTRSLMGSIPIFFKDLHINGGAPTRGSLEVTVNVFEIQLDSFAYTSNIAVEGPIRAVPDQGSSLALLAMGAGGILALRRWRAAQKRS